MEKLVSSLSFNITDPGITEILNNLNGQKGVYTNHFNQNEEAFLKTEEEFTVPAFKIHHDPGEPDPGREYIEALRGLVSTLSEIFPQVFKGTSYYFDPAEILRPCFIQLIQAEKKYYLYLFRPDLNIHYSDAEITVPGTNDKTEAYSTRKLFFESLIIPVEKPETEPGFDTINIKRMFRSTWAGESKKGYDKSGQWIDHEVTKLLSSVLMPEGKRIYPYYPIRCDFNTVCLSPPELSPEGRKKLLPLFIRFSDLIAPDTLQIEQYFKINNFEKDSDIYKSIRSKVPEEWTKIWTSHTISPYLNESDMKEYLFEVGKPGI